MGANISAEEEAILKLLMQLLTKRGVKYDPYKIKLLLKFLQKQGAPSTVSAVFDVKTWEQVREKIWEAASRGDTTATEVMTTWRLVTETLRSWQAEKKVQNAVAQAAQGGDSESIASKPQEKDVLVDLGEEDGGSDEASGEVGLKLPPPNSTPTKPMSSPAHPIHASEAQPTLIAEQAFDP
ncbi:hypothetical protein QYF61_012999 [Mycteria americana]|uniref:Beta-retroviral matrix protein domain-containing protein n=1 Tax=Mycteria americana TaxID=33587 RepID=A0AAN7NAN1_MYCAM|nr:hypothetical protein QYF61_012999 [Mycteria americana]